MPKADQAVVLEVVAREGVVVAREGNLPASFSAKPLSFFSSSG